MSATMLLLGGPRRLQPLRHLDRSARRFAARLVVLLALIVIGAVVATFVLVEPGGGSPTVTPPQPPATYPLPPHARLVRTSAGLIRLLRAPGPRGIVLADGVYDNSVPFTNPHGDWIYAKHLGKAVLTAGLVLGTPSGGRGHSLVRGVTFDVSDARKTDDGAIIYAWGAAGAAMRVYDCVFRGHRTMRVGVLAHNPEGLDVERVAFTGFTDEAIRASDNRPASFGSSVPRIEAIWDVSVDGVSRAVPGSSRGTAEAGIWVGEPVVEGVRRVRVRNVSISGIETVNNSWDTTFSDLDIDMSGPDQASGVGVYLEHYSVHDVFTNFRIVGAKEGFNAEWDDGVPGAGAARFTTIENGLIDAAGSRQPEHSVGVYLDAGTEATTIQRVAFLNQGAAAIVAYRNVGANEFGNNDYGTLLPGVTAVSTGS